MILDSSALLAILNGEPERDRMTAAIFAADSCSVSAPTLLETAMVAEGKAGDRGRDELDNLLEELDLRIEPFTAEHFVVARQAFRRYGKGQRHPAQLNFGDCIAYALSKATGEPLLFKGDDFAQTDIAVAEY